VTARALAQLDEERLSFVGELVHLRDQLNAGQPIDHVRASVERLLGDVAPQGTAPDASGAPPGAEP
jgi:hypothetical protein